MSHHERQNLISLFTSVGISIPYFIYVINRYNSGTFTSSEELVFWATSVLAIIPIRIVVEIIAQILIAISTAIFTGKEDKMLNDERDRLIELKGTRNSYFIFIVGMFIAMVAVATGRSVAVMFVILMVGGFFSEVFGVLSQLYYSRKGV